MEGHLPILLFVAVGSSWHVWHSRRTRVIKVRFHPAIREKREPERFRKVLREAVWITAGLWCVTILGFGRWIARGGPRHCAGVVSGTAAAVALSPSVSIDSEVVVTFGQFGRVGPLGSPALTKLTT